MLCDAWPEKSKKLKLEDGLRHGGALVVELPKVTVEKNIFGDLGFIRVCMESVYLAVYNMQQLHQGQLGGITITCSSSIPIEVAAAIMISQFSNRLDSKCTISRACPGGSGMINTSRQFILLS